MRDEGNTLRGFVVHGRCMRCDSNLLSDSMLRSQLATCHRYRPAPLKPADVWGAAYGSVASLRDIQPALVSLQDWHDCRCFPTQRT